MPGTPRKTAPKKAPAAGAGGDVIDLTSLLAPPPLEPATVTLLDETYTIRRDFTGAEVGAFWAQMNAGTDEGGLRAFTLLLGSEDAAKRLAAQYGNLPAATSVVLSHKLFSVAGLVARDGEPGESPAS